MPLARSVLRRYLRGVTTLVTPVRIVVAAGLLLAALFAVGWATRDDPADKPYLTVLGGGFVFNYRLAEVRYGFAAAVTRPLASGSVIEASFEDPAGGPPHLVRERVSTMTDRYSLQSPPVHGVEARRPYKVSVRVLDRLESSEIWSTELAYRSDISDMGMRTEPLTIGPGYHRNPAGAPDG